MRTAEPPYSTLALFIIALAMAAACFLFVYEVRYIGYDIQGLVVAAGLLCACLPAMMARTAGIGGVLSFRHDWPLLGFLVLLGVSWLSHDGRSAALAGVLPWIEAVLLFLLLRLLLRDRRGRHRFAVFMLVMGVIFATWFSLRQLEIWTPPRFGPFDPYRLNRNYIAQLLIPPLFGGLILWADGVRRRGSWLILAACALILVAIVLTRSRAVWLGLTVAAVFCLAWSLRGRNRRQWWRAVMTALLAAFSMSAFLLGMHLALPAFDLPSPLETLATLLQPDQGSAGGRLQRWINALPMLRDNPWWGVGPGNWVESYFAYRGHTVPDPIGLPLPFNAYIELAGELGIPALLLMVTWIAALTVRGNGRRMPDRLAMAGWITLCVAAVFHTTFSIRILLFNFFLWAAWCDATFHRGESGELRIRPLAMAGIPLLLCLAPAEWRLLEAKLHQAFTWPYYKQQNDDAFAEQGHIPHPLYAALDERFSLAGDALSRPAAIHRLARYGSGRQRNLYLAIARRAREDGDDGTAHRYFQFAGKHSPDNPRIYREHCALLLASLRPRQAEAVCRDGLAKHQGDLRLRLLAGRIQRALGNNRDALFTLTSVVTRVNEMEGTRSLYRPEAKIMAMMQRLKNSAISEAQAMLIQSRRLGRILGVPAVNKRFAILDDTIYYASGISGRFELWRWHASDGAQRISDDDLVYFGLQTSPGMGALFFISDSAGDGRYNVYRRDLESGSIQRLSPAEKGVDYGEYAVTESGERLAWVRDDGVTRSISIHTRDVGQPVTHAAGTRRKHGLRWRPGSDELWFVSGRGRVVSLDTASGRVEIRYRSRSRISGLAFTADGSGIAFAAVNRHGDGRIIVLEAESGARLPLDDAVGRVSMPHWAGDGSLIYREQRDGNYLLRRRRPGGAPSQDHGPASGVVYSLAEPAADGNLIITHADLDTPLAFLEVDVDSGDATRLHRTDTLARNDVLPMERHLFAPRGNAIPVYLTGPPADFQHPGGSGETSPLVIWLHGAGGSLSPRWHLYSQYLAAAGFRVAVINYQAAGAGEDQQMAAIRDIVSRLREIYPHAGNPFYIGVSSGSVLARRLGNESPRSAAGLVLYSPVGDWGEDESAVPDLPQLLFWGENDDHLKKAALPPDVFDSKATGATSRHVLLRGEGHDIRLRDNIRARLEQTIHFLRSTPVHQPIPSAW